MQFYLVLYKGNSLRILRQGCQHVDGRDTREVLGTWWPANTAQRAEEHYGEHDGKPRTNVGSPGADILGRNCVPHLTDNTPMMCGSESLAQSSASRRSITLTMLGLSCSMKWGRRIGKFFCWCSFNLSLLWKSNISREQQVNIPQPKSANTKGCSGTVARPEMGIWRAPQMPE